MNDNEKPPLDRHYIDGLREGFLLAAAMADEMNADLGEWTDVSANAALRHLAARLRVEAEGG